MIRKLLLSVVLVASYSKIQGEAVRSTFVASNVLNVEKHGPVFSHLVCEGALESSKIECAVYSLYLRNDLMVTKYFNKIELTAEDGGNVKDVSLIQYDLGCFVVKWLEVRGDVVLNARYKVYEPLLAEAERDFTFSVGLSRTSSSLVNDVVPMKRSDSLMFGCSGEACGSSRMCFIRCSKRNGECTYEKPLYINMERVRLLGYLDYNSPDYFIYGDDPVTGSYRLVHLSQYGKVTRLLGIDGQLERISSESHYPFFLCYVLNRTNDNTKVDCLKYLDRGIPEIVSHIEFRESVKLIGVWSMSQIGHSLMLLAEREDCVGRECWNLLVVLVPDQETVRIQEVTFDCDGSRKNVKIYVQYFIDVIVYACEKKDNYDGSMSSYRVRKVSLK